MGNRKDIWFNIQRRRYGGDLQGIIDKLDYLQELGVSALYLNPIFEAPSLHKYDGATYHHVDPYFGPDPEGDMEMIKSETPDDPSTWVWTKADKLFLQLVEEVHSRDMFIIIDGVFNHMGINSWAFKDVVKNQQESKYKDWFKIISWDDEKKGTKFDYEGWYGVRELPELKQDENGIVDGPKQYIFDATTRWMDPKGDGSGEGGIDGWRLDVAFMVKHPFWKDWRKHVKSINSDAYITAEIIDSVKFNIPYLQGDEFDAVMNYNFAFSCSEFFINDKNRISVTKFDKQLKKLREAYPGGVEYVMQNLFDSHDTQRLLSQIVNKDLGRFGEWGEYFELSKGSSPAYNHSCPTEDDIKTMKLMILMQMTYVGAPMIYYGDEVGMWGANDPCCRKPMLWEDIEYEEEAYFPDQTKLDNSCPVKINGDLFEYYKKLINIRNDNVALQLGDFKTLITDDENYIYAFERNYKDEKVIVVLNNSDEEKPVELKLNEGSYNELMNDIELDVSDESIVLMINNTAGKVLIKR